MKINLLSVAILVMTFVACNNQPHDHGDEQGHVHEEGESQVHEDQAHEPEDNHGTDDAAHDHAENHSDDEHEHSKVQYTAYTSGYELFAEADVFILNEQSNILAHFSKLPSFKPVKEGAITAILTINGKEVKQTLKAPTRTGIYSFDIVPEFSGNGTLRFQTDTSLVIINSVEVFADGHAAGAHTSPEEPSMINKVVYTKEQSWKTDFRTEQVRQAPFGQVIRTVAKIQPEREKEKMVVAKTSGVVLFSDNNTLEGTALERDQSIFLISQGGISENNISVTFAEAKNNYENAEANYERKKALAEERIISKKDLLEAKNMYENAKAVYDNLYQNFSAGGQMIVSPFDGFVKQVYVSNGQFVETGQPLISISQNHTLILEAMVQQKYSSLLSTIHAANVKTLHDNRSYTFEDLNGKILSYGKSINGNNFLLPVYVQVDYMPGFIQGSLVEVYLKTLTSDKSITIPNTAIMEEQGNYFAYVQVTPELFEKRQIKKGVTDGQRTEILSGIEAQERVISQGATLVDLAQASGALDPHSGHVH